MPYLIDGHNLIPKIPGLNLQSFDDEIQLIQRLQEFCRQTGKQIEVYFDNAPVGQVRSQHYGCVKAHFVRTGRTADDAIIAHLHRLARSAQNWIVVSSDHQVQAAARSMRAKVISSDQFGDFLAQTEQVSDSGIETQADIHLSSDEVDQWLDLFNGDQT